MTVSSQAAASVEPEVLAYYRRNWERIVHCYDVDAEGFPIDPAWYRRRLYNDFLQREAPARVLDVGCGAGQTVLDVLARANSHAEGIEPVPELVEAGRTLLRERGLDPGHIRQGDLGNLAAAPATEYDCIALLSVLPAIPRKEWDAAHTNIASNIRRGGYLVAAYRNHLFDLYTFNSLTMDFYYEVLWAGEPTRALQTEATLIELKSLVTHPDLPGPGHTNSPDKSFGRLERPKSNPLTLPAYLSRFGFEVERIRFCHFHAVPPLLTDKVPDLRAVHHAMEMTMADDWRGNFMAAMIFIEARKR